MGKHDNLDEFLDETSLNELKSKLKEVLVTQLKNKIDTGGTDVLAALKEAWEGDDYTAYETNVNSVITKVDTSLDTLWTEVETFIDDQITEWRNKEQARIDNINTLQ